MDEINSEKLRNIIFFSSEVGTILVVIFKLNS